MPSTPAAAATASALSDRYGRGPRSTGGRRPLLVVGIVVAVVAAVALGWVAWGMLQPRADGEIGRFTVVGDDQVDMILEITRPTGRTAVCTVEALGDGFAQVGLAEIEIEPAQESFSQVPVTMATSAVATVAVVRSCHLI